DTNTSMEGRKKPDTPLPPSDLQDPVAPDKPNGGPALPERPPIPTSAPRAGRPQPARQAPDPDQVAARQFRADVRRVGDTWFQAYERSQGIRPVWTKGKDAVILANLTRQFGADLVCELIRGYFETGTAWARERQAWTVGAFRSQWAV